MQNQTQTSIRCSSCGQPFNAAIYSFIDVSNTPQAKGLLLTGQLNAAQCPHCGNVNVIATPVLYHDPTKELLIAYVPMELNLSKDQQEKAVGDLMNRMPKDNFKGYMFNPRRALTMQGLIDQVLEADGVTPEMMEQQRKRVQLAQQMIETEEEELEALIQQHDHEIDNQFFQTLTMMAQRTLESGQPQIAQYIIARQAQIAELSSFGQELLQKQEQQQQTVEEVAEAIQLLGPNAERGDFMNLAADYAEDDERLQALVGLARPVFDYEFFQEMTIEIGKAPAAQREALTSLRQRLLDLTAMIDQQSQAALQNAANFLQALVNHPQPEQLIHANIHMIDDTFMAVLSANIQQAEKQADVQAATRLKEIYSMIVNIMQENMQPELRFVNELLTAPTEAEAITLLNEHAKEFGADLLEVMDAVEQVLAGQGNEPLLERLKMLRAEAQQALEA